jgi:hypothetical protein
MLSNAQLVLFSATLLHSRWKIAILGVINSHIQIGDIYVLEEY